MKIDRHNYEEYFILYLDNELSAAERFEVESFAKAHPDLQEELDILLQSKLVPDQHIIFEDKEELLSFANNTTISLSNYEEWLVLYMDNELTEEQRGSVEQFMTAHPVAQQDMNLFLQTKSDPETIVTFPGKASLYRREEKTRPIIWWRIAAAAAVLIAIATTAIVFVNKKSGTIATIDESIAGTRPVETKSKENTIPTNNSVTAPVIQTNIVNVNEQKISQAQIPVASTTKQNARTRKSTSTVNASLKKDDPVVSDNTPREMINKDAIVAINADKINTKIEANKQPSLTNQEEIIHIPTVTPRNPAPLYASAPLNDDSDGKKSKLRGFLRKVTRTFEKKTNIDATDDDDRLLVGGLAIKLK